MKVLLTGSIEVSPFWGYLEEEKDEYKKWGEGGTQVSQIGVELLERGHSVIVVTLDKRASSEVILEGRNLRICIGPSRSRIRYRMVDIFRKERKYVRDTIKRESPNIVHAHWTYEHAIGALATNFTTLITIRDWAPVILFNTPPLPYRLLKLFMAMYVFWGGDHFTANSTYISNKVKDWFGWNIPVIPNALRDHLFYEGGRYPNLHRPVFIAINNGFGPRKNVRTLLRAFHVVRKNCPSARLRLFGSSYGQGEEAHTWARSQNLTDNVSFCGKVLHDEVIRALHKADILVHPAREESFGNILVEAMSQKTPVIAGQNSGAVPWVLDQGRAGILTDINSPEILASSMLKLLESEDLWREYSEKGYRHAWNTFRLSKTVDKFESIYKSLSE